MVNFDSIKYLFEIPLGWYRKVHRACFESIGVDMVEIRPTPSGANEIGINMDDFTEAVKRVSKVKSVDGIEPNDEGDVELGAVREVDGAEPDEDGVVDFGLNGSEWMKTTADGHIGTTDEKPITLDGSSGVMYSNGNAIAYKTVGNGSSFDIASGNHTHTQYAEKAHTHKVNDITDLDLSGFLTEDDVGDAAFMDVGTTEGTVASGKHSHDLSDMKLIVPGHSGTCIVIMDNEGNLTHSGNTAYNLLNAAAETTGVSKLLTDKSIGTTKGTVAEGEHTHVMDDIVDLSEDILTVDDVGVVVAAKEHTHAEYADKVHTHTEYATVSAQEATQAVALAAGTLAQQAKDRADSAYQFASDNWGYILQVQKGVTTAQEMASSASTEAENAQATANTAKTTANTAKTTADSAKSTATTAQTTANAAKATADGLANTVSALDNEVGLLDAEVQLIADDYVTSKELANYIPKNNSATGLLYNAAGSISYKAIGTGSGQVAAGNHTHSNYATAADVEAAKSTAETAKTTANTAKSTADTAKSTADSAKSTATTA